MREIKFRALVEYEGLGKVWEYYTTFSMPMWIDRIVAIVHQKDLQYTGLKDKNGKEIYEGDIVRYVLLNEKNVEIEYTEEVVYEDCAFCVDGFVPVYVVNKECEVVGNIYENPELLQKAMI